MAAAIAAAFAFSGSSAFSAETLKLGMSVPLSGAAASWGKGMEWAGQKAVEKINAEGGVKAGGKTYMLKLIVLDNKYNAAEGTKVAHTLINREGVKFIAGALGTAPTKALQSISERKGVLLMTTAWGRSVKGPKFPLTFTQANTPAEVLPQLYGYIKKAHPDVKTVALFNPNDASGKEIEKDARATWAKLGVKVIISDFFERGTTQFQSVATKISRAKPDIVDMSSGPPATAGLVFKELAVQGWKGVKVVAAGTAATSFLKTGGKAVDGTYLGVASNFDSATATAIQRSLSAEARKKLGEPMNALFISAWDSVMAIKAGIEKANSANPREVAKVLPKIVFASSYGPTAFGAAHEYGSPQQMLVPSIVSQIKGNTVVEVARSVPAELKKKIEMAK
ncbi:MAG TPA: ABC transporter substrate-binding protein [Alphaproteobacteria bacterium]|nr:ABC transporter substrate-binding protein [Alphaproteobacteria bacterium]